MSARPVFLPVFFRVVIALMSFAAPTAQAAAYSVDEEIRKDDQLVWVNRAGVQVVTQGLIQAETADEVEIRGPAGNFTIKREAIKEIKPRRSAETVYNEFRKLFVSLHDREERGALHRHLGLWCRRPYASLGGEPPLPDRAFEHLYKAVEINPGYKELYPHLLDILAERREGQGEEKPDEVEREIDIYMLARAGGFQHPEIDLRLGELLHGRLGMTAQAIPHLEKVLGNAGGNSSLQRRARRELKEIYLKQGDFDKALALYPPEAGGSKGPAGFEAAYQRAQLLLEQGDSKHRAQVRQNLQKALDLQPDLVDVGRQLAALDFAEGKYRAVEEKLRGFVRHGSAGAGVRTDLALAMIQQGKLSRALRILDALLGERTAAAPAPAAAPADGEAEVPAPPPVDDPDDSVDAVLLAPVEMSNLERSRAHQARGLALDYRRDSNGALAEYRRSLELDPSSTTAGILTACAHVSAGNAREARTLLAGLIRGHADRRGLFSAYARVMADVEIAEGDNRKALNLLEYAAEIDPNDALLRRKIATLLLSLGELDRAWGHLEAAQKLTAGRDPALLNVLACYQYRRGEFETSRKTFATVISLLPKPAGTDGAPAAPPTPEHVYAALGVQFADDARQLEVWLDDFNREPGDDVARNWRETESYGIKVSLRDGMVLFDGQQANEAGGVTQLVREEQSEFAERVSVRLRFDASSGPVKAGLRIETSDGKGGPPAAGLVFYRDTDGSLRFARKTLRSGWEDSQPSADKDPSRGKLVYTGDMKWPAGNEFHTLLIRRISNVSSTYDLLFDGKVVAQNVVVDGLRGRTFVVGVSGQTEAAQTNYKFEADDFRLYRQKAVDERRRTR